MRNEPWLIRSQAEKVSARRKGKLIQIAGYLFLLLIVCLLCRCVDSIGSEVEPATLAQQGEIVSSWIDNE
jgi:hypothetical protein